MIEYDDRRPRLMRPEKSLPFRDEAPHAGGVAPCQNPEAVMLDLVESSRALTAKDGVEAYRSSRIG